MEKIQHALEKARQDRALAQAYTAPGHGGEARSGLPRLNGGGSPYAGGAGHDPRLDGIPLLKVSAERLARQRIVVAGGNGPAVEAFRILRTQVLGRLAAMNGRSLAVTSPRQREGKTFVALNLAIVLAQLVERSAILVDADLRRPSLCRLLGISPVGDLSDHLLGQRPLEACLVRPGIEDLVILPQKTPMRRSSELLSAQPMAALAEELKRRFPERIIIYDCPPLLSVDDPLIIQRLVDGVLLVAQEGSTTRSDLQQAGELIGEERYLGSVLNNTRWQPTQAYYG